MKFVEFNGIEIILRTMLQAGPENKEEICETTWPDMAVIFLSWRFSFNWFLHIWALDCNREILWRNGSASDSRSEGWVFESPQGQDFFPFFFLKISSVPPQWNLSRLQSSQ